MVVTCKDEHSISMFNYAITEIDRRCPEAISRLKGQGQHSYEVRIPPQCLPDAIKRYESLKNEFKLYYQCLTVTEYPYKFSISI